MKIRDGFVSNSSSSSFLIKKKKLTESQKLMIYNHISCAEDLGMYVGEGNNWDVEEREIDGEVYISLFTWMDNFDMYEFLKKIGIKEKHIIRD